MTEPNRKSIENFVSAKDAALKVGYSSDYVSKLARDGKLKAKKVGRNWFVDLDSLKLFALDVDAQKRQRQIELREQRLKEKVLNAHPTFNQVASIKSPHLHTKALLESAVVFSCLCFLVATLFIGRINYVSSPVLVDGVMEIEAQMQQAFSLGSISELTESWWWFVREEKQIVNDWVDRKINSNQNSPADTSAKEIIPPQVDVSNGDVLVALPEDGTEITPAQVAGEFSDNVLVEFKDARSGVITPEFRSDKEEKYPFRVVDSPVSSSLDSS